MWVLKGTNIDGVELFSKLDKLEEEISDNGAVSLSRVQTGTKAWTYRVPGRTLFAIKQKVKASHGL